MLIFIPSLDSCCQRSEFNNTLLYQSKGKETQPQEHQYPCPILLEFCHFSLPLCKNHKKSEVYQKIQACETLTLTKGFVFSLYRCSKQSVSRLLTLNWSKYFIRWGYFQICSGNKSTLLLLYACKIIHFINKGVISLHAQE